MHVKQTIGGGRHLITKVIVASALLGSSFIVGLATTASAVTGDHLVIATPPSSTVASGALLAAQPVITVDLPGGTVDTAATGTVTASFTSGGVSLGGATATISSGVATFTNLTLNALAGNYTLTFSDGSSATIVSGPIAVTLGTQTQLAITTQPSVGDVVGVALIRQPVVKVEDSGGNVETGVTTGVATATITGAGTISAGPTAPFSAGVATFSGLTLTGAPGTSDTLTFSGDSLTSVASGAIGLSGPAVQLLVTVEPSAIDASGAALAQQPVVEIVDSGNHVVMADNSTVTATITSGGVSVSNGTAVAVAGVATFSGLALNALASSGYTLTFSDGIFTPLVSSPVQVTLGAAAKLAIITEPSAAASSGTALAQQPVVKVEDSGGNLEIANASVVSATLTSGSGTITDPNASASAGIATFVGLAVNAPAGLYTLTFSDGSLTTTVSSTITIGAGAASQIVIVTEPSVSVASGAALAQQPVVKIEDSGGNVISGNSTTVTATVTAAVNTAVSNTAVVSASTGLATFAGLALDALDGTYSLTFSDGSLTTATSSLITVTPGVATKLVITTEPWATTASGGALVQQPIVKVEDAAGNVVTTDASTVTAKITTGGVSVTLPTKAAVSGVATFSGLALNALVGNYTLTFSDGSLTTAVSTNVAVTLGAPTQLVITTEPSASVATGSVLPIQPVVKVEDSGANIETGLSTGAATASLYSGTGGAISAGATANFNAGVATFSGLTLTGVAGTAYTLIYSGDSLTVIDTKTISVGAAQAALGVTSTRATYGRTLTLTTTGGSGTGAVSFTVTGGTATGCKVSGSTLSYSGTGTCLVTATKAADSTYAVITSAPATVNVVKLPIPGAVRITFASNSRVLSQSAKNAVVALVRKLTIRSTVTVTGYANANLALARQRAAIAAQFLVARLHVHIRFAWVTHTALQAVLLRTTAQ